MSLAAAAVALAVVLPGSASDAQTIQPRPSLHELVAEATQLSNEVDSLGQQYDGLQIQISHAENEERLQELDNQAGMRLSTLQRAQLAAARAQATAKEQITTVNQLRAEINSKVSAIHAKLDILNSSAMAQAMAIFDQTGQYPSFTMPLVNTVGATALRYALSVRGDPYIWGAAGPGAFDCSGLVVWAFAQEGISLPHYTGSLWNSGMHVSRSDLQPGDLVFFFADISHVGMYIGDGLMVAAPSTGQVVQVQPVFWNAYVGAVRII